MKQALFFLSVLLLGFSTRGESIANYPTDKIKKFEGESYEAVYLLAKDWLKTGAKDFELIGSEISSYKDSQNKTVYMIILTLKGVSPAVKLPGIIKKFEADTYEAAYQLATDWLKEPKDFELISQQTTTYQDAQYNTVFVIFLTLKSKVK